MERPLPHGLSDAQRTVLQAFFAGTISAGQLSARLAAAGQPMPRVAPATPAPVPGGRRPRFWRSATPLGGLLALALALLLILPASTFDVQRALARAGRVTTAGHGARTHHLHARRISWH